MYLFIIIAVIQYYKILLRYNDKYEIKLSSIINTYSFFCNNTHKPACLVRMINKLYRLDISAQLSMSLYDIMR